jgi:hypothetical protein
MQISCGVHPEVPSEGVVSSNPAGIGGGIPQFGGAVGMQGGGGHLMPDHVHMPLSVPPKCSVSNVMGFIKGKSAIHIARVYAGRRRNFVGQPFGARGFWVSTVGKNEAAVRQYIQNQEKEDKRLEQLEMVAL